jgi:1,4-dihydroxy-2-naphthoate octaprenyltransferase
MTVAIGLLGVFLNLNNNEVMKESDKSNKKYHCYLSVGAKAKYTIILIVTAMVLVLILQLLTLFDRTCLLAYIPLIKHLVTSIKSKCKG